MQYELKREAANVYPANPHSTVDTFHEKSDHLVGRPYKAVAVLETIDGTILDVIKKIKPLVLVKD